ncbi:hypothetical protein [Sandaracinus amylolyticus]|uniref:hypothetical protein n=1 Tax=Sandaracinus amylolyticus TaxID=927083 RepID=UPI001F41654B|nr:hypothetical protein [Sandaracinus amylolyticus]UJR83389.1 Hypothetical protein I5071_54570 [Sandaracinus amylolyticus]
MRSELKSNERRALTALVAADAPLSKGDLAKAVFGEVTGSTQSMISRITATLLEHGLIRETQLGRVRVVAPTAAGRAEIQVTPRPDGTLLRARLRDLAGTNEHPPRARNIKHLHGAAAIVASELSRRAEWRDEDERFAQAMLALIDEGPDERRDAREDRAAIGQLLWGWPTRDAARGALVDALARLEDPLEREDRARELGSELVRLAGSVAAHPDLALLWSAAAGAILGALRTRTDATDARVRAALANGLRSSLRVAEHTSEEMSRYWRARSLTALGADDAAGADWDALARIVVPPRDADRSGVEERARRVVLAVRDSAVVNAPLTELDALERRLLATRLAAKMKWPDTSPSSHVIEEIVDRRDRTVSALADVERKLGDGERAELDRARDQVRAVPAKLESDPAAREIASLHARRASITAAGSAAIAAAKQVAPVADGDLKRFLADQVRDNLWSLPMVVGHVAWLARFDKIVRNELS